VVARALILFFPLLASAQLQEIPIRLTTIVKKVPDTVLCEVDGTYFHISRSLLGKDITIRATNGTKLVLPWQAGECEEHDHLWRTSQ
jgi:hypothetical protein